MDFGLTGKLAVVTGSTSGIGQAIATGLASVGARVVINGRSQDSCEKAIARITEKLGQQVQSQLIAVPGDVSSAEGATQFIAALEALNEPVEVLVNNVGMFDVAAFETITDEKWFEYYEKNTMSGVRLSRHYLPLMLARNSGRIIFISSECAMKPLEHMIPYAVSKASQVNLARGLAERCKGTAVTVNSVLPGPTMTDGVRTYMQDFAKDKNIESFDKAVEVYFKEYEPTSLVARFLEPEEVANVVVFVASKLGSAINGSSQHAEGGIIRHT